MSPEEAAKSLDTALRSNPWYISVGVGATIKGPALFVYVRSSRDFGVSTIQKLWMGYEVIVRPVGSVRTVETTELPRSRIPLI